MLNTTVCRDGIHISTNDNEHVATIHISYGDDGGRICTLRLADRFSASNIPQDKNWGYVKAAEFAALAAYYQIDGNCLPNS